jgi:hypothetical protein
MRKAEALRTPAGNGEHDDLSGKQRTDGRRTYHPATIENWEIFSEVKSVT